MLHYLANRFLSKWPGTCTQSLSQRTVFWAQEEQTSRVASPRTAEIRGFGARPSSRTGRRRRGSSLPHRPLLLASAAPCVTDTRASEPCEVTAHRIQCKLGPDTPGPRSEPWASVRSHDPSQGALS